MELHLVWPTMGLGLNTVDKLIIHARQVWTFDNSLSCHYSFFITLLKSAIKNPCSRPTKNAIGSNSRRWWSWNVRKSTFRIEQDKKLRSSGSCTWKYSFRYRNTMMTNTKIVIRTNTAIRRITKLAANGLTATDTTGSRWYRLKEKM